jgi:hypothetical protein
MQNLNELRETVRVMRELGVLQYNGITLGLEPPTQGTSLDPEVKVKKIVKPGKRGRDGLTFIEQVELYTEARDATPDVYEE